MPKRTIEINDTLEERVESAIEDVKTLLLEYLDENPPTEDECPDFGDLDYNGSIHEIIDGSVPVYTNEIRTAWYLHHNELESAYQDAGIGNNPMENDGMTAVYCYIDQKVREWWSEEAIGVYADWRDSRDEAGEVAE